MEPGSHQSIEIVQKSWLGNIFHKGEFLLASCYFSAGAIGAGSGFNCGTLFDNDALLSAYRIEDKYTTIVPNKGSVFYPGNSLFVNLAYNVRTDEYNYQNEFDLAYVATCQATGDNGQAVKKGVVKVPVAQGGSDIGTKVLELFKLPSSLGEAKQQTSSKVSLSLRKTDLGGLFNADGSLKDGNAKLIFYNLNGVKANSFIVSSAPGLDTSKFSGIIGQSLNVNAESPQAAVPQKESFEIPYNALVNSDGSISLTLNFASEIKDLAVVLEYEGGSKLFSTSLVDGTGEYEFDKLKEGSCTLEIKILPAGQGDLAIVNIKEFSTYSPVSENIQVDSKQKSQDYKKMTFNIGRTPTIQSYGISMIEPYESASYCVDATTATLPLGYVFQTSDNNNLVKADVNYVLTLQQQTAKATGTIPLTRGVSKQDMQIPEIVNAIKGEGVQTAKFTYDLITQTNDEKATTSEKKESNSFSFTIRVPGDGDNCDDVSFYDYKPAEEANKDTPSTSVSGSENSGSGNPAGDSALPQG